MAKKHTVELKAGTSSAQFTDDTGRHIELDDGNPTFETANEYLAADLVAANPGLKTAGKKE